MEDVLRCPKCGIKQGKYRSKLDNYRCSVCGNIYEIEKKEEDEE